MPGRITEKLLDWYARCARSLPWRGSRDPYAVWVSEVMLQQTRVDTVIPYYRRWMEQFPDVFALAEASEQEVLHLWEGLGYYSRGRALQRAARVLVHEHGGSFPNSAAEWQKLPGVGAYTAAAVTSITFGADNAAIDGNVRRVLSRLFDIDTPLGEKITEERIVELARANLPPGRAGDYNQALMDLGAGLCRPRSPACGDCPLNEACLARRNGTQAQRPLRKPRPQVPHYLVTAAVLRRGDLLLIARRPAEGLLGGLWEFPGGKLEPGESLPTCLQREIAEELGVQVEVGEQLGVYKHAYTHFKVTLHAFFCRLVDGEPQALHASDIRWVLPASLGEYPMGKIDRMISYTLIKYFSFY